MAETEVHPVDEKIAYNILEKSVLLSRDGNNFPMCDYAPILGKFNYFPMCRLKLRN